MGVCQELSPVYRRLLKMALDDLNLIDKKIGQIDQEMAELLRPHQDQVQRLAEVPGLGLASDELLALPAPFVQPHRRFLKLPVDLADLVFQVLEAFETFGELLRLLLEPVFLLGQAAQASTVFPPFCRMFPNGMKLPNGDISVSSLNSLFAVESTSSPAETSPFSVLHAPKSYFTQNGPPGCTRSTSRPPDRMRSMTKPALCLGTPSI